MENHQVKKIGILGGSFDPIHFGHIAIAISLKEAHKLDEVLFIPANVNPQKKDQPLADATHRLNMLKLALQGAPNCLIETIELDRAGPSYMIDTLKALKKKKVHKNSTFFLLFGEDILPQFTEWKAPHELCKLARPLIARRHGVGFFGAWEEDSVLRSEMIRGITNTPLFDISATDIRKRIKEGLFCGHLLDKGVYKYIQKNKLYL